jgi:hypothetical protein
MKTWGSVYQAKLRMGYLEGFAAHLADKWEKNQMTKHTYHPGNKDKSPHDLLTEALAEMLAVTRRHFERETAVRVTIPAQATDSDVLICDALRKGLEDVEFLYRLVGLCWELLDCAPFDERQVGAARRLEDFLEADSKKG